MKEEEGGEWNMEKCKKDWNSKMACKQETGLPPDKMAQTFLAAVGIQTRFLVLLWKGTLRCMKQEWL